MVYNTVFLIIPCVIVSDGIGLVFNLVLVIILCALVRVRSRYGLQNSIPNDTMCDS